MLGFDWNEIDAVDGGLARSFETSALYTPVVPQRADLPHLLLKFCSPFKCDIPQIDDYLIGD